MKAKYPGTCPLCGDPIYEGQEIKMANVDRRNVKLDPDGERAAVHTYCANPFKKKAERLEDRWR